MTSSRAADGKKVASWPFEALLGAHPVDGQPPSFVMRVAQPASLFTRLFRSKRILTPSEAGKACAGKVAVARDHRFTVASAEQRDIVVQHLRALANGGETGSTSAI